MPLIRICSSRHCRSLFVFTGQLIPLFRPRYFENRVPERVFVPELRLEMGRIQRETVERLRQQGDSHLHFYDGSGLLGTDDTRFECTVDGVHPTDLGFMRIAGKLTLLFKQLLQHELA
nr:SGNH/GDSL hydrolase family protein [Paenibacillus thiaminolyticus]